MEEELNSCLFIFEGTGLQYFSLKKLTKQNSKDRPEYYRKIYLCVVLLCVVSFAVSYIVHDHHVMSGPVTLKNVMAFTIRLSMNCGIVAVIIISLFQSYMSTLKIKEIYSTLSEIAQIYLRDLNTALSFENVKKKAWKTFYQLTTFMMVLHLSLLIFHRNKTGELIQIILGIFPLFFMTMVIYKFLFYVDLVNCQLEFLKQILEGSFKNRALIKILQTVNLATNAIKTPEYPIRKVLGCMKIYLKIREISLLINESIGFTMLNLLAILVVAITVSGYELFIIVVGGLSMERFPGNLKI